jgi:transposase
MSPSNWCSKITYALATRLDRGRLDLSHAAARQRKLHDRIEALPQVVRDIGWKAQVRLCARYRRLAATGKPKVVVTTAIAREMLGFVWAIARSVQAAPFPTI